MECGYCGGRAVRAVDFEPRDYEVSAQSWVHADSGERVRNVGPGDMVSGRHNRAGTKILALDLVEVEGGGE